MGGRWRCRRPARAAARAPAARHAELAERARSRARRRGFRSHRTATQPRSAGLRAGRAQRARCVRHVLHRVHHGGGGDGCHHPRGALPAPDAIPGAEPGSRFDATCIGLPSGGFAGRCDSRFASRGGRVLSRGSRFSRHRGLGSRFHHAAGASSSRRPCLARLAAALRHRTASSPLRRAPSRPSLLPYVASSPVPRQVDRADALPRRCRPLASRSSPCSCRFRAATTRRAPSPRPRRFSSRLRRWPSRPRCRLAGRTPFERGLLRRTLRHRRGRRLGGFLEPSTEKQHVEALLRARDAAARARGDSRGRRCERCSSFPASTTSARGLVGTDAFHQRAARTRLRAAGPGGLSAATVASSSRARSPSQLAHFCSSS